MFCVQLEKFRKHDFGRCPSVNCYGQPCLPFGQSDVPRSSKVKIYCPKCEDIYYPRLKYQDSILFFPIEFDLKSIFVHTYIFYFS